ncbi:hypothetical protein ACOI9X_06055 [Pseudomonas sp. P2757]|uniref:hypothetical protein n=1 Tax=unclassified Pseudomonas TaxID=196821 RepID=UPI003B59D08C
MGKGIKMVSAVDTYDQPHTLETLQHKHDNHQTIPALLCDGGSCKVPVRFVPRGLRNNPGKEPSDIAAYIGLTAGAESDHKGGCKYDALGQLRTIIAAQSDPDFIGAIDEGQVELRLLLLHNSLGGKSIAAADNALLSTGSAAPRRPSGYQATGNKLDSYLRTTSDILKLRARCEADDVLKNNLILRFGDKRIRWSEFFFEHDRYEDAWKMANRRGAQCHPFAIAGTVNQLRSPKEGSKHVIHFLNLRSEYNRADSENTVNSFDISVGDRDATWLKKFPKDTEIIIFGVWSVNAPRESPPNQGSAAQRVTTFVNHGLTLYPKFHRQLLKVD